jgi:hypothetical protein
VPQQQPHIDTTKDTASKDATTAEDADVKIIESTTKTTAEVATTEAIECCSNKDTTAEGTVAEAIGGSCYC